MEKANTFNSYMSHIDADFFRQLCIGQGELHLYKKGESISKEGDIFPYWGYIESGIIKYTCRNVAEKKEYNTGFSFAGEFMADYPTCLYHIKSEISIQALTNCRVYICHSELLKEEFEKSIENQYIARIAAEQMCFQTYSRYTDLYRLTPEERYKQLIKRSPNLFQLIPVKEIPFYLKIIPIHMSGIRKSINWRKQIPTFIKKKSQRQSLSSNKRFIYLAK